MQPKVYCAWNIFLTPSMQKDERGEIKEKPGEMVPGEHFQHFSKFTSHCLALVIFMNISLLIAFFLSKSEETVLPNHSFWKPQDGRVSLMLKACACSFPTHIWLAPVGTGCWAGWPTACLSREPGVYIKPCTFNPSK